MRERFRAGGFELFAVLLILLAICGFWVDRTLWKSVATGIAVAGLAILHVRRHAAVAAVREAEAATAGAVEAAYAAADASEKASALTVAGELATAKAAIGVLVNATIVEVVAARQAVVRAAHPDDVMLRLTAAEDSAHDALISLDRLDGITSSPASAASENVPS